MAFGLYLCLMIWKSLIFIWDPLKASTELGWGAKTTLEELVNEMIKEDLLLAKKEVLILNKGFSVNSPKETPPTMKDYE